MNEVKYLESPVTAAFWSGFEKRAKAPQQDEMTAGDVGLATGAATTGGLAAHHVGRAMLHERAERARVPNSKRWKDFVGQLKPGDVLFSRSTKRKLLPDVKDVLQGGMGSPHYHAALYTGKGRVFEHPGAGFTSSYNSAKLQLGRGEDVVAYRPNVDEKTRRDAVTKVPKELSGRKYKTNAGVIAQGAENLLVPGGGGKACTKAPDGRIVRTTVIQRAYNKLFTDTTNVEEMRRHKNMNMVARLQRPGTAPSLREKMLYRGVYPIAKNLKWGLGAGGLAYLGKKVHDYVKKDGGSAPPSSAP